MEHRAALAQGQRARDIDRVPRLRAGRIGRDRRGELRRVDRFEGIWSTPAGHLADGAAEIGDGGDPAEELLDVVERRLAARNRARAGASRPPASRRNIRGGSRRAASISTQTLVAMPTNTIVADAARAQHAVELRVEEAPNSASCARHDVARLRRQRIDQLVVPAAARQQLALQLGPRAHGLERVGLVPVGRARAAGLDIVGVPAVLEIDHRHARARARSPAPARSGRSPPPRRRCRTPPGRRSRPARHRRSACR